LNTRIHKILPALFLIILFSTLLFGDTCLFSQEAENVVKKEHYRLSPGDTIEIEVYEEDDLSGEFEIKDSGDIAYPLLGKVKAAGLTKSEIENRITELLGKDYLVHPYVRVIIKDYHARSIMVMGSVGKPGSYEFPEDKKMSLLQAISIAGGFTRYASVNGTKIVRTGKDGKKDAIDPRINEIIKGNKEDVELQPNDLIVVPERVF